MSKHDQNAPSTERTLIITFKKVSYNHDRLLAGYLETRKKDGASSGLKSHTFSKAVEYPLKAMVGKHHLTKQKIKAVGDFLKGAKAQDKVTIYTQDSALLKAVSAEHVPLSAKGAGSAAADLVSLSERFKVFKIKPILAHEHYETLESLNKIIQFRINDIKNTQAESKQYVNKRNTFR